MKPTSDSGYVFCGVAWSNDSISTEDFWVVKVDCHGCDSVQCYFADSACWVNTGMGIKEVAVCSGSEQCGVVIYPNPFSNSTTLQITNDSLPLTNLFFEMHDVLGRKVKQLFITSPLSEIKRDDLPSGVYFYQIRDKRFVSRGQA